MSNIHERLAHAIHEAMKSKFGGKESGRFCLNQSKLESALYLTFTDRDFELLSEALLTKYNISMIRAAGILCFVETPKVLAWRGMPKRMIEQIVVSISGD